MTDGGNDSVKELLGRAFGQEPPLGIDREEVLQQGRKRLRRKRVFEAGGVVAAVVVVALGAATLTNLTDSEPERMPPAATTTTAPSPTGPELPLSPPLTTTTTTSPGPPSSSLDTSVPKSAYPLSVQHALWLTQLLSDSHLMSPLKVEPAPGGAESVDGMPKFRIEGDAYLYEADARGPKGEGFVQIAVDYAPGQVASCQTLPFPYTECSSRQVTGQPMVLARWDNINGERRYIVFAVLADGTRIAAMATNTTKADRKSGVDPDATRQPVLDGDDLGSLIGKSGFSVH